MRHDSLSEMDAGRRWNGALHVAINGGRGSVRAERASAVLFVSIVVIPLLFAFMAMSIDVVKVFTERAETQQLVDAAAMQAAYSLPYKTLALQVGKKFIESKLGTLGAALDVVVGPYQDDVQISLTRSAKLGLLSYFGFDQFDYLVRSRARVSPLDAVFLVDDSVYLAPPFGSPFIEWTGGGLSWAASAALDQLTLPSSVPDTAELKHYLTQRCFNPPLVDLKSGAIASFDHFTSQRLNAAGLMFYTDLVNPDGVFLSRYVLPAGVSDSYGNAVQEAAVDTNYAAIIQAVEARDANCAAIEQRARDEALGGPFTYSPTVDDPYQYGLTAPSTDLNSPSIVSSVPPYNIADLEPLRFAFQYNSNYLTHMSAREAIWTRGIRDGTASFATVLASARATVEAVFPVPGRAGMETKARKAIYVFAGDVPWQQGERFPFSSLANTAALDAELKLLAPDPAALPAPRPEVMLYYFIFPHQGNGIGPDYNGRVSQLETFFSAYPQVKIFKALNGPALSSQVVSETALLGRRVVLAH